MPGMARQTAPFFFTLLSRTVAFLHRRSQGSTFLAIASKELAALPIPALSFTAQQRIAGILLAIDDAIERTEALIAKYQQIKAGLMHDLFTRGVTPDGRLRPPRSEAPHLYKNSPSGWIPEEWSSEPMSAFLVGGPKNGFSPREVDEWSGLWTLGLGCLTQDGFRPNQLKMISLGWGACTDVLLAEGDLLMSRSNTRDLVGFCGVYAEVDGPCIYPDLMMRIRPNIRTSVHFLEALLLSPLMRIKISGAAVGTSGSMVKLNSRSVLSLILSMPEKGEQSRILEVLAGPRQRLASLDADLSKLHQLKQGLMHDLLTGRVRVKIEESPIT